jgi:hypothetical protein
MPWHVSTTIGHMAYGAISDLFLNLLHQTWNGHSFFCLLKTESRCGVMANSARCYGQDFANRRPAC